MALSFAARGYRLVLHYSSTEPVTLRSILERDHPSVDVLFLQADLSSTAACLQLAERTLAHFDGVCDVLVSNAGAARMQPEIWDIPVTDLDHLYAVNVRPSFVLSKAFVPAMKAQGFGRLVFVSSISAIGGGVNGCHYAASKGAMSAMMKNLAAHLAPFGITANDVAPALIEGTGMIPDDSAIAIKKDMVPVRRLGKTQEIARVVETFIDVGYLTGQSVLVSGGLK